MEEVRRRTRHYNIGDANVLSDREAVCRLNAKNRIENACGKMNTLFP